MDAPRFDSGSASNFPPEVSAAIGRYAMGSDDDRDRQVLIQYLISSQGSIDPDTANKIGQIIGAMGGAGPQTPAYTPQEASNSSQSGGSPPTYQGSAMGMALPGPRPPGPPLMAGPPTLDLLAPNQPQPPTPPPATWKNWDDPATYGSPRTIGMGATDPASMTTLSEPNIATEDQRQAARRGRMGDRGGTNWKGEELDILGGPPGGSAFDTATNLQLYADNPELAAYRMSGGDMAGAAQKLPYLQTGLALARQGTLTGRGRTLESTNGPASARDQLTLAENLVNGMQPGTQIDPRSVYRDAFKRARHTDPSLMNTGQGVGGDENNQIQVTSGAMMNAATWMTDESAQGLQDRLNMAAAQWMDRRAQGDTITFPEYLRSIGAKKWVAPGLSP